MRYLIALVLTGIFVATTQNYFCKNLLRTKCDNFAYSIIVYIVALISTFIINGCRIDSLSGFTVIDGIIYGLMLTTELYCTLEALKIGPLSFTTLFIVASSIIPIIPSWIIWKDPITWQQIAGIIVMFAAVALVLDSSKDQENKDISVKWFVYAFIAFLASGCAGICEKILTISAYANEGNEFIMSGLIAAVIMMTVVLLILRNKKKEEITMHLTGKMLLPTAAIGLGNSLICILTVMVLSVLSASVTFTINNGARLIALTIIDRILFKVKISRKQYCGIALGIVGIVLLSI